LLSLIGVSFFLSLFLSGLLSLIEVSFFLSQVLCERQAIDVSPSDEELARHPHTYCGKRLVWMRPYADSFLDWCMTRFAVALWSSGKRRNILPIVQQVIGSRRASHFVFTWCQEECTLAEGRCVPIDSQCEEVAEDTFANQLPSTSNQGVGSAREHTGGEASGEETAHFSAGDASCGEANKKTSARVVTGTTDDAIEHALTKPLLMKDLHAVWRKWPCWGVTSTVLLDDDPHKCELNPPATAVHPAKWRALAPPAGTVDELAPRGGLRVYLERLREAESTQEFIRSSPYSSGM